MFFGDYSELLALNAMWLYGFMARHKAGLTECEHEEMVVVEALLAEYEQLKANEFASGTSARLWLQALSRLVERLWD